MSVANAGFSFEASPRGIIENNPSFSADRKCNLQQNPEIASISGFFIFIPKQN